MPQRGFTLLELIITLVVLALILSVGLPRMNRLIDQLHAYTLAHTLQNAITTARQRAIVRDGRVTLRALGGWESGWELFDDVNHNGEKDPGETLVFRHSAPAGHALTVQSNRPLQTYVSYLGNGASRFASGTAKGGFQAGSLYICTREQRNGYALTLARMGRLRLRKIDAEACAAGP